MKYRGSLFPLLLVGVLAGLTFWLQRVTEPGAVDRSGRMRHDPDFVVENFSVKRFDAEGSLQHTLRSTRMDHYPDDDTTVITKPEITFHRNPPTRLSADSAWVSTDAREVRLEGNVRLARAGEGRPDTVVATSRLNIFPEDETARGDAAVSITHGLSVVDGAGIAVDNKASTVRLLGPVRGTIHRKSAPTGRTP